MDDNKIKERFEAAEAHLAKLDQVTAELTTELRKLRARTNVLERPVSEAHGVPEDLDASDADIAPLVTALTRAWEVEQPVLTEAAHARLRQTSDEYEKLLSDRDELASSQSGRRFVRSNDRAEMELRKKRLDWHITSREAEYDDVTNRLREHEKTVQDPDYKQLMGIADEARAKLPGAARKRIERALVSGNRMPVWFTVALGAPRAPDPSQWVNIGVALLAYRLEYGINDPITALGPKPAGSSDVVPWQRRIAAFDKLLTQLRDFYS